MFGGIFWGNIKNRNLTMNNTNGTVAEFSFRQPFIKNSP